MQQKSDLILEYSPLDAALPAHSPIHTEQEIMGFKVISSSHGDASYSTVVCKKIWTSEGEKRKTLLRLLASLIHTHSNDIYPDTVLAVGLGSSSLTSDSLGPLAVSRLIVNDDASSALPIPKICAISPGVPAKTGLDTAIIVRALAEQVNARLILTVDSLCATLAERLCKVVQITNGGITPGSALAHSSGEISRRTMPCPVVSIGVPTVIRGETLSHSPADRSLLVSPADADIAIDCYASLIGGAINSFFLEIPRKK